MWIDDWSLTAGASTWRLRAAGQGYALELDLTPAAAPVLNGEAGFSRKSDEPGARELLLLTAAPRRARTAAARR